MERIAGIPNFWNVVTNAPFLAVGAWGLARLYRGGRLAHPGYFDWAGVWASTAALGVGSTIFHWWPSDATLALDRACICAVTAFMAAHALRLGLALPPRRAVALWLLLGSLSTVIAWHQGAGLEPYGAVRALATGGALALLVRAYFRGRLPGGLAPLGAFVLLFAGSIAADVHDGAVRAWTGSISGHALKHLLAALALAALGRLMVAEERASPPLHAAPR